MPEGPEARVMSESIQIITGHFLSKLRYNLKSKYRKGSPKNYVQLTKLLPLRVLKVYPKGKKVIISLDNEATLVFSLGMSGHFSFEEEKHSNMWLEISPCDPRPDSYNDQLDYPLFFTDARHFGSVEILLSDEETESRLAKVGPDLMNERVSKRQWLEVAQRKRLQHMKIYDFLMEQKYFSGCGNYVVTDSLYHAKIHPFRTMDDLSEEELLTIKKSCEHILRVSYQSQGFTQLDYFDAHGRKGVYQPLIYGKKKNRQDEFGNDILQLKSKGRTLHYVKEVQV